MSRTSIIFISICLGLVLSNSGRSQTYEWLQQVKTDHGADNASHLDVDDQGNTYLAGRIRDTLLVNGASEQILHLPSSSPYRSLFLLRTNAQNENTLALTWDVQYGGEITDLETDENGDIYVSGYFYGAMDADPGPGIHLMESAGNSDGFILKVNAQGELLWAIQVGSPSQSFVYDVELDGDEVVVVGSSAGQTDFYQPAPYNIEFYSQEYRQAWFAKFKSGGGLLWFKYLESEDNLAIDHLGIDDQGNLFILLRTYYLASYDLDPGSGIVVYSDMEANTVVAKYDEDGNYLGWTDLGKRKSFHVNSFDLLEDQLYLSGYFLDSADFYPGPEIQYVQANEWDAFVLSLNLDLQLEWFETFGGPGRDICRDLGVDSQGNLILLGEFEDTLSLPNYFSSEPLVSEGGRDLFIMQLNSESEIQWLQTLGSAEMDHSEDVSIASDGSIYYCGMLNDSAEIDLLTGPYDFEVENIDSTDHEPDIFLLKLSDYPGVSIRDEANSGELQVYPNPSSGVFSLGRIEGTGTARVFNIHGQVITDRQVVSRDQLYIDGPAGIYFLELVGSDGKEHSVKLTRN